MDDENGVQDMSNKPAKSFKLGSVEAAIWSNERTDGAEGTYYTVTVSRRYKDGDGNWQDGNNYFPADLLNLGKVTERAEDWIANQ